MKRIDTGTMVLCVLSLAILPSGCAPAVSRYAEPTLAATATLSDALRQEAERMAEQSGISVEEAIRRTALQGLIGNLNAELQQHETATFAGLWVQQEPEYRVVVAFTRKGRDTVERYVEGTALAELIQVRSAEASLNELVAAEQEANQVVHELGFPFSTAVDIEGNRVVLWVTDRERFEAALQDAGRELPEHVELVVVYQPPVQTPAGVTPVPDVAFPQLRARSTVHFDLGPLQGTLRIQDGCLRVGEGDRDAGRLIIWQPDYFLNSNQGVVEILDAEGSLVARVGEQVRLTAAGETDWEPLLRQPLPEQCPGPYWVMDGIVHE